MADKLATKKEAFDFSESAFPGSRHKMPAGFMASRARKIVVIPLYRSKETLVLYGKDIETLKSLL
jgi:hypothetical protein